MSEPTRLLDGALPPDIAAVLQSANRDVPPDEDNEKRRICATAASSGLLAAPPARSKPLRHVAWLGLAVMTLSVGAAGVHYAGAPTASGPQGEAAIATTANEVATPSTESEPPVAALPSMRVDELPSAMRQPEAPEGPPQAKASASAAPSAHAAPARLATRETTNVADELKVIDAARGALSANQPAAAYAHIQHYRTSFPTPHFVDEADALEVQALAALGRNDEARTKAKRFLEAHPGSPYTQRVRSAAGLPADAADARP